MKDLTSGDRPREKLLRNGPIALGDNELIALVLGSGLRGMDSLHVANELLRTRGGLHGLVRSTAADFAHIRGIGAAKAAQLLAAQHRHPGHHTFGYVVEGTYEFAINGEPGRILNAGETFYEPPTAVHSMSRNPSADKRTKIIVFMVADQKNPSTVAE